MIYANNAGTSWPKPPSVQAAVNSVLDANPVDYPAIFEDAHAGICAFLGVQDPQRLLITSGCTAALSLAIGDLPWQEGDVVITSSVEHHALARTVSKLESERGVTHVRAPYLPGPAIDLDAVESTLGQGGVRLVAVTAASNVTGEILPLRALADLAHQYDALFLVDAAQIVGLMPVNVATMGADLLTFAGHKGPLGPQGIGGLWAAPQVQFASPWAVCEIDINSAAKRQPCSPFPSYCDLGSVNLAGAAGLAAGMQWLSGQNTELGHHARALAAQLVDALEQRPGVQLYGSKTASRTATLSIQIDALPLQKSELFFAESGVFLRAGSHCAPWALDALDAPHGALRISFGPYNTHDDLVRILEVIDSAAGKVM